MTVVRLALLLIAAHDVSEAASSLPPGQFGGLNRIIAASSLSSSPHCCRQLHQIRGGAVVVDDDSDDYDVDDDDDDDDEKLATSTKTVVRRKKAAAIKSKVKVAMTSSSSSGSASSTTSKSAPKRKSLYKSYVPYIIRACLNPFTLIAMTKAYFISLCDINYLKEVSFDIARTRCLRYRPPHHTRSMYITRSSGILCPSNERIRVRRIPGISDYPPLSSLRVFRSDGIFVFWGYLLCRP